MPLEWTVAEDEALRKERCHHPAHKIDYVVWTGIAASVNKIGGQVHFVSVFSLTLT